MVVDFRSILMIAPRSVVAIAVLVLTASCGASTQSSSAPKSSSPVTALRSPVPVPAFSMTFRSPTMGYSVRYAAGWTITLATDSWPLGKTSFWDTPDGDRIEGDAAGFRGTSQALAPGQSASQWIAEYISTSYTCGTEEQVPVGDQLGTIDLNDCPGAGRLGGRVFDIAVVAGGRGYNFTMEGRVDRAFFLAMLATVTFSPQTARP
jgi:hypothetical protein